MAALPPGFPPPPPPLPPAAPGGAGGAPTLSAVAAANIAAIEAAHPDDHIVIVKALEAKINEILRHKEASLRYKQGKENGVVMQEVYGSITGEALLALRAHEIGALNATKAIMDAEEALIVGNLANSKTYRDLLAELQERTAYFEKKARDAGLGGDLMTMDLLPLVSFRAKLVQQYRDYAKQITDLQTTPDSFPLLQDRIRQHRVAHKNICDEIQVLSGAVGPVATGAPVHSVDTALPHQEIQEYCKAWALHKLAAEKANAPMKLEAQIVEELSKEQMAQIKKAKELVASYNGDQGSKAASGLEFNKGRCIKLNRERMKESERCIRLGLDVGETNTILTEIDLEIFEAVEEIKRLQADLSEYTIASNAAEAQATVESMKSYQMGNLIPRQMKTASSGPGKKSASTVSAPQTHLSVLSETIQKNCPEAYTFADGFYSQKEMVDIARALGITNFREKVMLPLLISIFNDATKAISAGINRDVQRFKNGTLYEPAEFIERVLGIKILARQAQIQQSKAASSSSGPSPSMTTDQSLVLQQDGIGKLAEETEELNKDLQALHDKTRDLERALKSTQLKLKWVKARAEILARMRGEEHKGNKFVQTVRRAQYVSAREAADQHKQAVRDTEKKQAEMENLVKTAGPQALLEALAGPNGAKAARINKGKR